MKVKSTLGYKHEPEKYLIGVGEPFINSNDTGLTVPIVTDLVGKTGFRAMRIWMHNKYLLTADDGNELHFREDKAAIFRDAVERLRAQGVTHITAMNHNFLYPAEFEGDRSADREYPNRACASYRKFLEMCERSYEMIAARFPEIVYWEIGNEINMNSYMLKPGFPKGMEIDNESSDPRYYYTDTEKTEILADICYYCNRGIKKGNPNAYTVLPGLAPFQGYPRLAAYLEKLYSAIESGDFPTGAPADTDPDHYFQVLAWHPYNWGGDWRIFVDGCNLLYDVAKQHGDEGKKAFMTEFGYHDADFIRDGADRFEADSRQAAFFATDYKAYRELLPFVETAHIFRMFDWLEGFGIELDFGLFTSPLSENGIRPKEKGKAVYRLIHGSDEGMEQLYRYEKK